MNSSLPTTADPATLAAAEGQAALGVGDTALARQKYAEAGAILEREMKARRGGSDKQLLRFLAATQYYKGGHYQKAQELAARIEARVLPGNVRGLLPQFLKDVKEHATPEYAMGIRKTLSAHWLAERTREAIALLQEHPYVVDATALAFLRATLCARLQDYRASVLFFAAALRHASGAIQLAFMSAATPLRLMNAGRLTEAWECVQHQVELLPHPVTYVTASVICYHRATATTSEGRRELFEDQLAFAEKAWEAYQKLRAEQRDHPDMRAYMVFGLEAAVATWLRIGNKERTKAVWERAVRLEPNHAVRVFATDPSGQPAQPADIEALFSREAHFSVRFTSEPAIRQQLELVGA